MWIDVDWEFREARVVSASILLPQFESMPGCLLYVCYLNRSCRWKFNGISY